MASLKLEHIYKVYPNGTKAVNDVSLDIKNGEFIVFVGPSGCGKSTTLRMIAGLEEITAGELYIDNQIVNDVEPKDRDIAMVFQNYALYPHMTVYENMAFGLKLRHVPDDVIQEKVLWASEILGIKDYLDRKPRAMSGGQRQRVALGRAILRDPKVMLLDEPLSNLDAKLRTQMRTEIAKLHQKLKTTFIYVTHDQVEAMTLGDRVVVMKAGRIQQVDTPKNLYDYPSNIFVAGFIGTPQMNFFDCTLLKENDDILIKFKNENVQLKVPYNRLIKVNPDYLDGKHPIILGIRCEHVHLTDKDDDFAIKAKISRFEELGSETLIYATLSDEDDSIVSEKGQIIIKSDRINELKPNETICIKFDLSHTYFFDKVTEETITPRLPKENVFDARLSDKELEFLGMHFALPLVLQGKHVEKASLIIPVDAFRIDENGVCVKVIDKEVINGFKLYHLLVNNRVFFAVLNEDLDVETEIKLSFDYSKITVKKDDDNIIKPIQKYDEYKASFYNYQTVISKGDFAEFTKLRDEKIKSATQFMDAQILLENNEYEKQRLALIDLSDEEKSKLEQQLKEFIDKNRGEIKEIKAEAKKQSAELKSNFTSLKKKLKSDNDRLFDQKKADEIKEFNEFKKNNKDKDALKRRSDEYHIFKDNFQSEKENTLNLAINSATMDYEAKISSLNASTRRKISLLKKEIHEKKKEYNYRVHGEKSLLKEHVKRLKILESKRKDAIERASLVFFFKIENDCFALLSDIISNKLIQGLGTRVFSKEFKVEVPHDAYHMSDSTNSIKGTVVDNLDYESALFAKIKLQSSDKYVYVKVDESLQVGQTVSFEIDVSKSMITETGMNIRLY